MKATAFSAAMIAVIGAAFASPLSAQQKPPSGRPPGTPSREMAPPPISTVTPPQPASAGRGAASQAASAMKAPKPDEYLLTITVVSGDDDLRSDSYAWMGFYGPDDKFLFGCQLKSDGETWENSSSHPVKCHTHLSSVDELRKGRVQLNYDGGNGEASFHTYDNWTVDGIHVQALDITTNHDECVMDAAGAPLVRMTGQFRTFGIQVRHAPCATSAN
jgi:hypothetical protein